MSVVHKFGILAMKVSAWEGLSVRDKSIFKFCFQALALGIPTYYEDHLSDQWGLFSHWVWNSEHIAIIGSLAANVNNFPAEYEIPLIDGKIDRVQLEADIRAFIEPRGYVPPNASMNTWQDVLDAQNTPPSMVMDTSIPPSWNPVI